MRHCAAPLFRRKRVLYSCSRCTPCLSRYIHCTVFLLAPKFPHKGAKCDLFTHSFRWAISQGDETMCSIKLLKNRIPYEQQFVHCAQLKCLQVERTGPRCRGRFQLPRQEFTRKVFFSQPTHGRPCLSPG